MGQVYFLWIQKLFHEFFQQGDLERTAGLPIQPFMDRCSTSIDKIPKAQVGFINYLARPLFESWLNFLPETNFLLLYIDSNLKQLQELVDKRVTTEQLMTMEGVLPGPTFMEPQGEDHFRSRSSSPTNHPPAGLSVQLPRVGSAASSAVGSSISPASASRRNSAPKEKPTPGPAAEQKRKNSVPFFKNHFVSRNSERKESTASQSRHPSFMSSSRVSDSEKDDVVLNMPPVPSVGRLGGGRPDKVAALQRGSLNKLP